MKCQSCGTNNESSKIFCKNCGSRLQGESSGHINPENHKQKTTKEENYTNKVINQIAKEGCTSKAWRDIKSNPNWLKRLLIVGLCNIIPIINFASCGYAQKWGIEATKNNNTPLKKDIFEDSTIKTGFFEWITWLVFGFVFLIASIIVNSLLGKIFIVGAVIGIALGIVKIFWNAFTSLAAMKSALDDKLGSSFSISKLWEPYKNNWKKIFCAYFVPSIICKAISAAFCLIIVLSFAAGQFWPIINMLSNINSIFSSYNSLIYAFNLIASFSLCAIICYCGSAIMLGIERVIRYRALGIFIERYAKEWI